MYMQKYNLIKTSCSDTLLLSNSFSISEQPILLKKYIQDCSLLKQKHALCLHKQVLISCVGII